MVRTDDDLRTLLDQAAAEEAFLDSLHQAEDARRPNGVAAPPASVPALSLMITNRQRVELQDLGFSDQAIRLMTPAEAHAQLGIGKPSL